MCATTRSVIRIGFIALTLLGYVAEVGAQSPAWPWRTVRIIVPYPPGGSPDIIARLIASQISEPIGQPVVVENRAGANGQIATDLVSSAPPDGHTLLLGSDGPIIITPLLAGRPVTSGGVIPVTLVAITPFVLVAGPSVRSTALRDLIHFAKANPGKLTFGSAGNGSQHHLGGELLKSEAAIDIRHVPYRGFGPAAQDVISGHVDLVFGSLPAVLPYVKAGNVRAVAVAASKRAPELADVPTGGEQGLPTLMISAWFGVMAPRGTPDDVVARIHGVVAKSIEGGVARERLIAQGMQLIGSGPDGYAERIKEDAKVWEQVIKKAGIKMQ